MFKYLKPSAKCLCLLIVAAFCGSVAILNSCSSEPAPPGKEAEIAEGGLLAKRYCTRCHLLPSPAMLDKESWVNGVLPAMAVQLGVQTYMGQYFCDNSSALSTPEWQKIVSYYRNTSPAKLVIPKLQEPVLNDWAIFSLQKPAKVNMQLPGMTTMITTEPATGILYTADAANNLYKWDGALRSKLVHQFDSPVTGLDYSADGNAVLTCIGNMAPINSNKGKVYTMSAGIKGDKPLMIADSLPRPVQTVAADFNKDGLMDYVVCGFGHDNGGLYLLQQQPGHKFKKQLVYAIPGGEQMITGDFNGDGWTDVICLFAQADEGIRMFLNDQKGGFITKDLLRFEPEYGSSSFQLIDINHDGKPDILYTCGDNSDYSKVLKPYHGVYIFINQGDWKFKQTYFYHIDGCTKAIAADFDHDGDYDIAAIAFFSDFKYHPQEAFTWLEQTKPGKFTAHEIPVNNYGRWLTMDVADINKDGYPDIVLGNFSVPGRGLLNQKGFTPKWDTHTPIIVLKNNGRK